MNEKPPESMDEVIQEQLRTLEAERNWIAFHRDGIEACVACGGLIFHPELPAKWQRRCIRCDPRRD